MKPTVSVIVCTHNPRQDYLNKVLKALEAQTLSKEIWELLLIDNASEKDLALETNISWHPQSYHVREEQLGLTPARLRGIKESVGELLIFVDDDNILNSDYLEISLEISKSFSVLGAWGGQTIPEFDEQPPEWTKTYWHYLAIHEFDRDQWSNSVKGGTHPCGAGMCVRRAVAEKYTNLVSNDPKRISLDRKGKSLASCGDTDLAFTACDLSLGIGRFKSLKLLHLMPSSRLQEDYLLRLAEGVSYSSLILCTFRDEILPSFKKSRASQVYEHYRFLRMRPRERRFYQAIKRGEMSAIQDLSNS